MSAEAQGRPRQAQNHFCGARNTCKHPAGVPADDPGAPKMVREHLQTAQEHLQVVREYLKTILEHLQSSTDV